MILGLFWFLVANTSVALGSAAVLRRLATGQFHVDVVIFLLVRLCIISAVVIVAGLSRTLTPLGLGLAGALTLAVLLALREHHRFKVPKFTEVGLGAALLAAAIVARLLCQVWFFAPYSGDVLSYHLPKVAEWVRAGEFTREMGVDTHVTFPAGLEIIETWWVVFFRHDALIEMGGVEFLILAFFACYSMAKGLGLEDRPAFFAALIFVLTPSLHLQATSCANDGAAAGLVVSTFALVLNRASIALVLLGVGLGLGVKPTYAYALPGIAVLWFLGRRESRTDQGGRSVAVGLAVMALAVGAFWYLRNALWFGNPIYPVGLHGLHGSHPIQSGVSGSSLVRSLSSLVTSRIYDSTVAYGPYTVHSAGWGAAPFALGFIALLHASRQDLLVRRLALSFLISLASTLLLVKHDPWCLRFALFFPCIFAPPIAVLASRSRPVLLFAWLALGIQFLGTNLPDQLPMEGFRRLGREPWNERSVAKLTRMWHDDEAVGYFVDNRNLAYLLYRPDFSCRVAYLRAKNADELLEEIRSANLRMIYAVPGQLGAFRALQECETRGRLRRLEGHFYSVAD